ncbi:unnamed protein product [Blepharisma stoltei]|uniref:Uncharacterized protein n=1 Tax=Blepharisma stoltei TaxID=1481888 RepID=A0AAU9IT42_9CILI|nr:unnamed protein product [Blepharisma stoltei]
MADLEYDYSIRAALIEDYTVGKSSLFDRYDKGASRSDFYNCAHPSFTMRSERFKEFIIRITVWNTSGYERFGELP